MSVHSLKVLVSSEASPLSMLMHVPCPICIFYSSYTYTHCACLFAGLTWCARSSWRYWNHGYRGKYTLPFSQNTM